MNPTAINLWVTSTAIGFCVNDAHGAALGLAISSGVSFVLSLFIK